jgi:hypothetical protein
VKKLKKITEVSEEEGRQKDTLTVTTGELRKEISGL